jgi:hypothetical protein
MPLVAMPRKASPTSVFLALLSSRGLPNGAELTRYTIRQYGFSLQLPLQPLPMPSLHGLNRKQDLPLDVIHRPAIPLVCLAIRKAAKRKVFAGFVENMDSPDGGSGQPRQLLRELEAQPRTVGANQ